MDKIIDSLNEEELQSILIYNLINSEPKLKDFSKKISEYKSNEIKIKAKLNTINTKIQTKLNALKKKLEDLEKTPLENIPTKKPIRIYLDGVFDIIHSGHFNAIRQAKKLGDILVVGVNADDEVTKAKGPPLMNQNERAALAAACKWTDEVAVGTLFTPTIAMLDELKCDYCSHGDDITLNENGESCYDEIMKAGRMKLFKRTEGVSTTAIIGRLLLCAKENTIKGKGEVEMTTSAELIKQFADLDEFEKNRKPVMSSFLATSWRITEFSSNKIPKKGDKVVYIDGAFDILHIGHIETLKKAKEMGDFLYVGVHDDFTVNKFRGKNYPILNLNERVFNLLALKYVDEVIIGAPWKVTDDMIQSLKINIVVQGTTTKLDPDLNYSDIKPEDDPYEIPKKLGIFQSIQSNYDLSNDILIERLMKNREVYIQKYLNKAKKDNIFYDKEEIHEI